MATLIDGGDDHGRMERPCLHRHHGFGPLGSSGKWAMAPSGGVISFPPVPIFQMAWVYASKTCVPGGKRKTIAYHEPQSSLRSRLNLPEKLLLPDAQTSGGLLWRAVDRRDELVERLEEAGCSLRHREMVPAKGPTDSLVLGFGGLVGQVNQKQLPCSGRLSRRSAPGLPPSLADIAQADAV